MDIDISRFQFDEVYRNDGYGEIVVYFNAPDFRLADYPESESTEISVCFPIGEVEPAKALTAISPTRWNGDHFIDYDWHDITLSYEDIERLMAVADNAYKGWWMT